MTLDSSMDDSQQGWTTYLRGLVIEFCEARESRTFELAEFRDEYLARIAADWPENNNVAAKIRQQLQFLRDKEVLSFVDNRGRYTLRELVQLKHESKLLLPPLDNLPMSAESLHLREVLFESFTRSGAVRKQVIATYGPKCLLPSCQNTFTTQAGEPYIEVHHIAPIHTGGEDVFENCAPLCAHHHRYAHLASEFKRIEFQRQLEERVQCHLSSERP